MDCENPQNQNPNIYSQQKSAIINPKASVSSQHSYYSHYSQPQIYQPIQQNFTPQQQFQQIQQIDSQFSQSQFQQQLNFIQQPQLQFPIQQSPFQQQFLGQQFNFSQGQNLMAQQQQTVQSFQNAVQIQPQKIGFSNEQKLEMIKSNDNDEDEEYNPDQKSNDDEEQYEDESESDSEEYIDDAEIQEEEEFDDPDFNLEEYLKVRDQL